MDDRSTKTPSAHTREPATIGNRSGNPRERGGGGPTAVRAPNSTAPVIAGPRIPGEDAGTSREAVDAAVRQVARAVNETVVDERNDVLSVINELEDQLDRYEAQRGRAERDLTQTRERLTAATVRSQELEWQVAALQARLTTLDPLSDENRALQEEAAATERRCAELSERLAASEQDCARLRTEVRALETESKELWSLRTERDGLRSDVKLLKGRLGEAEQALQGTREESAAARGKLNETAAALSEMRAARQQLEAALRASEDRVRQITRGCESLDEKLQTAREERKALQTQVALLERENARLLEQRQSLEVELTSAKNESRTAEAALTSVKRAFGEVRVALAEAKSRTRRRTGEEWPRPEMELVRIERDIDRPLVCSPLAGEGYPETAGSQIEDGPE